LKRASIPLRKGKAPSQEVNPPNHWHGRLGTYPLGYQINASWVTTWPLYSNRVMRGSMVE